jgi:hypothetical protein
MHRTLNYGCAVQIWWVVAVELVGLVLFLRCTRGWSEAGRWEFDNLVESGRFTRRQVLDARRFLVRKSPDSLSDEQKELAMWWARHIGMWGLLSMRWSLGAIVGIELMLSGVYAFGSVGLYVLIPQVLLAACVLGTEDLFGHERRNAANWPGVNKPDGETPIDNPPGAADSTRDTAEIIEKKSRSQ